jgi:hypothetical protein
MLGSEPQKKPLTGQPVMSVMNTIARAGKEPIPPNLSSELSGLLSSFVETMKPTTSMNFNLAWTYGGFLEEIPRRLGRNEARKFQTPSAENFRIRTHLGLQQTQGFYSGKAKV